MAIVALTLIAGVIRLVNIADPHKFIFDEVYYAKEGCYYAEASYEFCNLDVTNNEVHPPLGKWLISAGIKLFDFNSTGYRMASVIAGTLTVVLLYLLARKTLSSTLGASVTTGALAFDPLHFVQSRTSMLDIFVPLFAVGAFLCLVYDRQRLRRDFAEASDVRSRTGLWGRPWRLAAGLCAGGAVASKWTGGLVFIALIGLTLIWEITARRRAGRDNPIRRALAEEGVSVLVFLLLVPALIYTLTYAGRGIEGAVVSAPWSEGSWWQGFGSEQADMWQTHTEDLDDASHPYESPGWSWPLLKRPVSYFFETDADGDYREILATGNPFTWWASLLALVYVLANWLRRPGLSRPEGVILGGFFFSYGPWLLPNERSTVFLFYFVATLPFMFMALGYVATRIGRSWEARAAVALFTAIAVGYFFFFYPLLTKRPLSEDQWRERLLFFDNKEQCKKPPGRAVTTTVTKTTDGDVTKSPSVSNTSDDEPPKGWCWI